MALGGVSIGQPTTGLALVAITPAMQTGATPPFAPGVYAWEGRAALADGTVSTQAYGVLNVRNSLFTEF